MATAGVTAGAAAAAGAAQHNSSYRVKFRRKEFLGLVEIIKPRIIYHRRRMHVFAFEGFVMHTFECEHSLLDKKSCMPLNFQTKHGAGDSKTLRIVDSDQSSFLSLDANSYRLDYSEVLQKVMLS